MSTNENGEEVIVEDAELDTPDNGGEGEGNPTVDWEQKARELEGRLKRAETKLSKNKTSNPVVNNPSTSNGLDYGMKALLRAEGIKGESETKLVEQFMQETGKTLEQVIDSKFFKAELEEMRELAKTEDANPKGKRTGTTALDSVEYWLGKPFEEVPKEMRAKVVNAKQKASQGNGVFYNS